MWYAKKQVTLPEGMEEGSCIMIAGEGNEPFYITKIERDDEGDVVNIRTTAGCNEPLCKLCLWPEGQGSYEASNNRENWVQAVKGECDQCGAFFQDSCVFWSDGDKIFCRDCREADKKKARSHDVIWATVGLLAAIAALIFLAFLLL